MVYYAVDSRGQSNSENCETLEMLIRSIPWWLMDFWGPKPGMAEKDNLLMPGRYEIWLRTQIVGLLVNYVC
jgi:hypothetical protein